ncbi:methyltransferase family protein [Microbacterium gorillae]|uniref:methyltransferase family protein n=1 Tax=Microbacterium gorillae TaxID=1231063 RepID=UPI000694E81D|nr:isoprenylcysteine carboxylmethyltransferase family protein [Microbacterium gorillae]
MATRGLLRVTPAVARAYFGVQALTGAAWWICVFTFSTVRLPTLGELDPLLIALPDIPLFVVGSALIAAGVRWAVWIVVPWTVLVAAGMTVHATITTDTGCGALLMIAAAGGSIVAGLVIIVGRLPTEWIVAGPFGFRAARAERTRTLLGQTSLQIAIFWSLLLFVIPAVITWVEDRWGLRLEPPPGIRIAAGLAFVLFAALGLCSAVIMATRGAGTPLPAAMAHRLVVAGPYRWVRNPMAVAGIGQGVCVGIMLESWLVVAYALAGALIWNWAVRPHEEADLGRRFGAEFAAYRDAVPCWIPRLRPVPVRR